MNSNIALSREYYFIDENNNIAIKDKELRVVNELYESKCLDCKKFLDDGAYSLDCEILLCQNCFKQEERKGERKFSLIIKIGTNSKILGLAAKESNECVVCFQIYDFDKEINIPIICYACVTAKDKNRKITYMCFICRHCKKSHKTNPARNKCETKCSLLKERANEEEKKRQEFLKNNQKKNETISIEEEEEKTNDEEKELAYINNS